MNNRASGREGRRFIDIPRGNPRVGVGGNFGSPRRARRPPPGFRFRAGQLRLTGEVFPSLRTEVFDAEVVESISRGNADSRTEKLGLNFVF